MATRSRNGNNPFSITWQGLALIIGVIIAITTGAIQLGTVQTHVIINTQRVDKLEDQQHKIIESVTTLQAQRSAILERLDTIIERLKNLETPKR